MSAAAENPAAKATHDVRGKVCLVTGANTGIGFVTARELVRAGAHVFAACRSRERGQRAVDEIKRETGADRIELLELDLASLQSVRDCAAAFLARDLPLHVLVCNAGLAGLKGVTKDGFELTFGVNHLGHFLLTSLLLEKLRASAPARIVVVSSRSHYDARRVRFDAFQQRTTGFYGLPEYAVSKLCNVLFTRELARRLEGSGVTTYAVHPGTIASDVWRQVPKVLRAIVTRFMRSNEEGAMTTLHCATAPELATESGLYYSRCRPKPASRLAHDDELARTLWSKSVQWSGAP